MTHRGPFQSLTFCDSIKVGAFFTGPQREEGDTFQNSEHLSSPSADSITLPCPPSKDSRLSISMIITEI